MFQVYIKRKGSFSREKVGEFEDFGDAQDKALAEKEKDNTIRYTIEETTGGFNSYGELLSDVIEEG